MNHYSIIKDSQVRRPNLWGFDKYVSQFMLCRWKSTPGGSELETILAGAGVRSVAIQGDVYLANTDRSVEIQFNSVLPRRKS